MTRERDIKEKSWTNESAAAESLGNNEDWSPLELDGLTSLSDTTAESLRKHDGPLHLDGLRSLSDVAAENLDKHKGDELYLDGLASLSDAATESLSKHKGYLSLSGLTSLSDAVAESLSKHEGRLSMDLENFPESATEILRQHPSFQDG